MSWFGTYHVGSLGRIAWLARAGMPYVTLPKVANALLCEWEKFRKIPLQRSVPYTAVIDVMTRCNLTCPYCPTGCRRDSGRSERAIEVSLVKKLIEEVGHLLISANLYNWGEPLLHPEIATMINLFHRRRIFTRISSNLSIKNHKIILDACDAGLDYMIVSLSGTSQETHQRYHRGADLDLVLDNVRRVIEHRRATGRRKPIIELKYLTFKHNLDEVATAREIAREMGVEVFRYVRGGGEEDVRVSQTTAPSSSFKAKSCLQLWHAVILTPDGSLAPCCFLYFKEDDFGDFSRDGLLEIRNNKRFETARTFFRPSAAAHLPQDLKHPCLKCSLVHEQPHLKDYLRSNPYARQGHRTGGP